MPHQTGDCPVCSAGKHTPVSDRLFYCKQCRIVFNADHRTEQYSEDYFVDDYRAQYGKTYEEDFNAIYAASYGRLDRILKYIPRSRDRSGLSLLDIGSALGFFLKCAKDRGIGRVQGIEISSYASSYCRNRLAIPVDTMSFPERRPAGTFDIITAWYFIEHTASPVEAIRLAYSMLNPGGVFAFSAPSIFGPMFRRRRNQWIEEHPRDHRIDFTPKGVKMILKTVGFTKISVRAAGIHPERIVPATSPLFRPFRAMYRLLTRWIPYSDTMEVYAVK